MVVSKTLRRFSGFTLIESIVAIVIISVAMLSLTFLLFPQIQDSARSHYEVRASSLAQSLMTKIISRGFDHNSDPDGGTERCGEGTRTCSTTLGADIGSNEVDDGVLVPENFNDVDDYIGCWYSNEPSKKYCTESEAGSLTDILAENMNDEYPNFAANVAVVYDAIDGSNQFKKVTITITAGNYGNYSFVAHRGNY